MCDIFYQQKSLLMGYWLHFSLVYTIDDQRHYHTGFKVYQNFQPSNLIIIYRSLHVYVCKTCMYVIRLHIAVLCMKFEALVNYYSPQSCKFSKEFNLTTWDFFNFYVIIIISYTSILTALICKSVGTLKFPPAKYFPALG